MKVTAQGCMIVGKQGENMELDNDVRFFRKLNGIRIRDLRSHMGVGYSTIQRIESGEVEPRLSLAIKLAEYFKVPLEELFFKKGTKLKRTIPDELLIRQP